MISQCWVPRDCAHLLVVPLRQQGEFIGGLSARRTEVRPFTPAQIKLLETFADQAVIAIENVRLFKELKSHWSSKLRRVKSWALSPARRLIFSLCLDVVAENAARLCEATDACRYRLVEGDGTRLVASFGTLARRGFRPMSPRNVSGRAILDAKDHALHDLQEAINTEFPDTQGLRDRRSGHFLACRCSERRFPLVLINFRRTEVRPFSDKHINLLETFADQAVIAIENVRLFKELQARTQRVGAIRRGTESVGRSRPGSQLYPRSPDCAQHYCAPGGPTLRNRWRRHL